MSDKLPWFKFFTSDWLSDLKLSKCSPTTRGIWIDLLCAMHELDRCGQVCGTIEELARMSRCQPSEIELAVRELESSNAANVEKRDGMVTLINRKMTKEYKLRESERLRKERYRKKEDVPPLSGVRPRQSSEFRVQSSDSEYQPPQEFCAGVREALAWAGVGGGWKKCAEIPGLTPIGIVILAEEIRKTDGGPGLIVQKITNGYTPPKLIAAETLSRLSRQGRIASICGHEVRASDGGSNVAYSTHGVLVISDQGKETRLKANEILTEQIVVKLDKELA